MSLPRQEPQAGRFVRQVNDLGHTGIVEARTAQLKRCRLSDTEGVVGDEHAAFGQVEHAIDTPGAASRSERRSEISNIGQTRVPAGVVHDRLRGVDGKTDSPRERHADRRARR